MGRYTREEIERARSVRVQTLLCLPEHRKSKIRCPFHNERTPSCQIYLDGGFHCFGCGKHGKNSIDFLMEMGYSFSDSVKELLDNKYSLHAMGKP